MPRKTRGKVPRKTRAAPAESPAEGKGKDRPSRSAPGASSGNPPSATRKNFVIAGVGASAGGLEALQKFCNVLPAGSGIGVVVVQHMDPRGSMLTEILGKNAADLKSGGGDRRLFRTIWYLARRNALGVGPPASRKEAGDRGTVEVFPVCDSVGRVTNYVAVRQKPAGLRALKRVAEGSSFPARLSRLAAGIAHNINNQLCVISGYAGMLLGRAGEGESAELCAIRGAAERIASTTRRLLAYAQMQEMHPERTDLNAFVASFLDAFAADVGEDVDLCRELAPDLGEASIDRKLFGQVLADLADSACRAMPGGGRLTFGTANVDLKDSFVRQDVYMRRGRYVMVSVRHSGEGPGDAPDSRIFEPFSAGLEEPRGLLLPAVYGGVKQCGGYIWVFTRSGNGTTFNIYLPRADQE